MVEQHLSVLVVDDEPAFLLTMEGILADRYAVRTFSTPVEALQSDLADLHVVCADFSMPGMNGVEFLERLRDRNPIVRLLLITGLGELTPDLRARLERLDGTFIRKPVDPEFLLSMVANLAETAHLKRMNALAQGGTR